MSLSTQTPVWTEDAIEKVKKESLKQRFRKNRCDVILGFALNIQGKSFPRPAIVG